MNNYNLSDYINMLIANDNILEFYKTTEWKKLRLQVLKEDHYECVDCASSGKLSKAVIVHHVNEVKLRPDLALSKYYITSDGLEERNLVSLCFNCHEIRHNRMIQTKPKPTKYYNKEWW